MSRKNYGITDNTFHIVRCLNLLYEDLAFGFLILGTMVDKMLPIGVDPFTCGQDEQKWMSSA